LRVGEIRKNLLRGLGDDVLTLRHSVPRFELAPLAPLFRRTWIAVFSCTA
jgi:hypothetical protein